MGFGTPVALLVGIILILIAVGLFFLDRFKPGYRRDSDTVYAVLFLAVGIMSLVNWNQNFLESFQLMIFAGMLIALVIESVQRRNPNAQVKQVAVSYREEERERPSRSYRSSVEESPRTELRVELDDDRYAPIDEYSRPRRIRGTGERSGRDSYAGRSESSYDDGYSGAGQVADEPRGTRRRRRSGYEDGGQYTDERSQRSPLQLEGDLKGGGGYSDPYSAPYSSDSESSIRRRGTSSKPTDQSLPEDGLATSSRSRRRRPRGSNGDRPTDDTYVDYKPIQPSSYPGEDEFDNSNNFDDGPKFS